jgi:hypothetical protein
MDALPEALQKKYAALKENRALLEAMKLEQGLRGEEKHLERRAHRAATHTSWRQMGGARLFLHEINHPGNKPFAIGFGYVFVFCGCWWTGRTSRKHPDVRGVLFYRIRRRLGIRKFPAHLNTFFLQPLQVYERQFYRVPVIDPSYLAH